MFPETSPVLNKEDIIPFSSVGCIGNKALFLLISSRVDDYLSKLFMALRDKGIEYFNSSKQSALTSRQMIRTIFIIYLCLNGSKRTRAPPAISAPLPLAVLKQKGPETHTQARRSSILLSPV